MLGANARSECDYMWTCFLLDLYPRLGEGESGMSAMSAERTRTKGNTVEGWMMVDLGREISISYQRKLGFQTRKKRSTWKALAP
jgi:hypothetical protein